MKNNIKSFFGLVHNPEVSIEEDKQQTVDLILYITNVLGLVAVIIAIFEYTSKGIPLSGYFYILFFLPFIAGLIFRSKLKTRTISWLIISSGFFVATYVMFYEGFASGSLVFFLGVIVITTFLQGLKESLWVLGLTLLIIAISAYLFMYGILEINSKILYSYKTAISWASVFTSMLFLSLIMILSINRMYQKLIKMLTIAGKKTEEAFRINKELSEMKQNLEHLVHERTLEIEEKNKRLVLSNEELRTLNEELERLNNLFVGREFRIKELRDRVKELEGKQETNNPDVLSEKA
ncbi:MAG: hypothetical protein KDC05_02655 [Bacteroidales bacterium]|nr:hypothetical protein [Bacteroidales bacterium]